MTVVVIRARVARFRDSVANHRYGVEPELLSTSKWLRTLRPRTDDHRPIAVSHRHTGLMRV